MSPDHESTGTPERRLAAVPAVDPPDLDDVGLMSAIARGDEAAFGELYDRMARLVHGGVRKVVRDPSQSDEVTQAIFVEAWRTATRFEAQRGSPRTWVLTMAHRRAIDRVRSEQASRDRTERVGQRVRPFDEVAELLDAPLGTIKTRMRDGLIRLRDAMGVAR